LQGAVDGLGIILAPGWLVCEDVRAGRLTRVLPSWSGPDLAIHCVWSSGRLRGKAKLFAEHMADALKHAEELAV